MECVPAMPHEPRDPETNRHWKQIGISNVNTRLFIKQRINVNVSAREILLKKKRSCKLSS
jgi:hypothetical protein